MSHDWTPGIVRLGVVTEWNDESPLLRQVVNYNRLFALRELMR